MRLPPLNALRAFEAAARHGGFVGASEELHVTRGAISRHIKLLEDQLGLPLFRRHPNGVELTDAGRRLLPTLTDAFGRIATEIAQLSADASDLRILCPPATSIRWLIPRMEAFRARHPDIRVRLTTDFHGDGGFEASSFDIAFSVEHWPRNRKGLMVEPVFPVHLTPACAPGIAGRLSRPEDLGTCTLLHETPARLDWSDWLTAFPVAGLDPRAQGEDFPNLDLAVRAALLGTGVVMADLVLCRDEFRAGTLVQPFPDLVCPSTYGAICLLGRADQWDDPKVRAFRDWVRDTAEPDRIALSSIRPP